MVSYDDVDDAVGRCNASDFGLSASVWTSDVDRGYEVANRLEAGTVAVNQHMAGHDTLPFGGFKHSGLGREGGREIGLREYTEYRSCVVPR